MARIQYFKQLHPDILEVVKLRCKEQDSIFDENAHIGAMNNAGGFDWSSTIEEEDNSKDFWWKVLGNNNLEVFYTKYPKNKIESKSNTEYIVTIKNEKYKVTISKL